MNIPKSTISDYENDKCEIKTGRIMELANHLHTTPNYLFGYEEKNTSEDEAIMELLSKIKDKKMKDMIMAQIIFASKMEED